MWMLVIMQIACFGNNNAPKGMYDPPICREYQVKEIVRGYDTLEACNGAKAGPQWLCLPEPKRKATAYCMYGGEFPCERLDGK